MLHFIKQIMFYQRNHAASNVGQSKTHQDHRDGSLEFW